MLGWSGPWLARACGCAAVLVGEGHPPPGRRLGRGRPTVLGLDQALGIGLGPMVLIMVVTAVAGTLFLRYVQHRFWPTNEVDPDRKSVVKLQGALIAVAVLIGFSFVFFPTDSFIDDTVETPFYIVPRAGE